MNYSDHWAFQNMDMFVSNPEHNSREAITTRFSRLAPERRVEILHNARFAATADDGSTLRQRAQLLSLNRDLEDMHASLLRAGR